MSDRVAILRDGRLAQFGSAGRALRASGHPVRRRLPRQEQFPARPGPSRGKATASCYRCGSADLFQTGGTPAPGDDVLISLRPEKLEVGADVRPTTRNLLEATLIDCTYVGTDYRLIVEADGLPAEQRRLIVTLPTWRCRITPEPGRRIAIGWEPDASTLVADD